MAEVKIYRAAYKENGREDAAIGFSNWVSTEGIDEVVTALESSNDYHHITILGWEEKTLDTDPV